MNAIQNKVQLIGNLGKDPEVKNLTSGKIKANSSLATSENYRNAQGEKVTDTQWHNVVAWGKIAEIAENYLQKGNKVAIEGKLVHRVYDDSEGQKRYITEVVANSVMMLDAKPKA
jgi:single-strand DNA-binding protein